MIDQFKPYVLIEKDLQRWMKNFKHFQFELLTPVEWLSLVVLVDSTSM